jgi:hypothetical protein
MQALNFMNDRGTQKSPNSTKEIQKPLFHGPTKDYSWLHLDTHTHTHTHHVDYHRAPLPSLLAKHHASLCSRTFLTPLESHSCMLSSQPKPSP